MRRLVNENFYVYQSTHASGQSYLIDNDDVRHELLSTVSIAGRSPSYFFSPLYVHLAVDGLVFLYVDMTNVPRKLPLFITKYCQPEIINSYYPRKACALHVKKEWIPCVKILFITKDVEATMRAMVRYRRGRSEN